MDTARAAGFAGMRETSMESEFVSGVERVPIAAEDPADGRDLAAEEAPVPIGLHIIH